MLFKTNNYGLDDKNKLWSKAYLQYLMVYRIVFVDVIGGSNQF